MSCKGIFPSKTSGQIEDGNKSGIFGKKCATNNSVINIQANTAYHEEVKTSRPITCQDVAQSNVDEALSNCSTSTDSIRHISLSLLPTSEVNSDHGSDISLNVDDWFKPRTESVSSMDLDAVSLLKNECIDANYLVDSNTFLTAKENVDMCIVTSICDIGLELDLPISTACKNKFTSLGKFECVDKDCNVEAILGDYHVQDSLMNDFTPSDILDKDPLLIDDAELIDSKCLQEPTNDECNLVATHIVSSNCIIPIKDGESYICSRSSPTLDDSSILACNTKRVEVSQWTNSPLGCRPDKVKTEWVDIEQPNDSSHCVDIDPEQDFSEFNYLEFQADSNEGIINSLKASLPVPQIDLNKSVSETDGALITFHSVKTNASVEPTIIETSNEPVICFSSLKSPTDITHLPTSPKNLLPMVSETSSCISLQKKNVIEKPDNIKITVMDSATNEVQSQSIEESITICNNISNLTSDQLFKPIPDQISRKWSGRARSNSSVAVIAISTDKSKSTTEIVINTSHGEQVYKGKSIDFIKGSKYVQVQQINSLLDMTTEESVLAIANESDGLSNNLAENILLTESQDIASIKEDLSATLLETIDLTAISGDPLSDGDDALEFAEMADRPTMEALAEIGVTEENLFRTKLGNGRKFWVCPIGECGKLYPRLNKLKTHILGHYGRRPYKCDFEGCRWSFYKYVKLKRHKETHEKRKDYECPKEGCGRSFTTVYNLKTHLKLHDRPAEMVCSVEDCRARFQTKRDLEVHMRTHDREHAPYKCTYLMCGKHYYSANALNSHTRSHQHKEEELRCQYCGKLFDKPSRLKFHMRCHTGDKPYPCTFEGCGWAFTSSSKLNRHMFKHTNVRKFKCMVEDCSKSFMRSEHLKEHTLTHIQARSFECPIEGCYSKFQAKSSLYVHLKKHRENVNPETGKKLSVECPIADCNRTYTCKSSLRQHMLKFHTPLLASDPSHYIALLTVQEDVGNTEGLPFDNEVPANCTASIVTSNPSNVTSAVPVSSEGIDCSSHSSNNDRINFQNVASQQIFNTNNNATQVLLTQAVEQANVDLLQVVSEPFKHSTTVIPVTVPNATLSTTEDIKWTKAASEPVRSAKNGCARTRYTLNDFLRDRAKKLATIAVGTVQPNTHQSNSHQELTRCISDVVLGTGTVSSQDIAHGFLLQDDLPANHYLYHEDQMIGTASGVGELHILLDSDEGTRQEFAESTINLRDLE